METVYVGATGFANEASREDDLGGGKMYAALIRQAVLKRLNQADANVATEVNGNVSTDVVFGRGGAVIANTSNKTDIPMQLVCPVGFKANLSARIASETGKTLSTCTVGEFIDAFAYTADSANVSEWATFISWLESQWRSTINDVIARATSATMETVDGDEFSCTVTQIPALSAMSDLLNWAKSIMPAALQAESVQAITSDLNPDKLGFSVRMTTTYWAAKNAAMQFYFRL